MLFMPMIVCVFYFYEKVISVVLNSLNVRLKFLVVCWAIVCMDKPPSMVSCSLLVHIMNTLGWCEGGRINIDSVALPVLLLPLPCRPVESSHRIKRS